MHLFLDSFWRAAIYCVRPRVIVLSLVPLLLVITLSLGLGYFYWDMAVDQVRSGLDSFATLNGIWQWLESVGLGRLRSVLAPLLVVFAVTPLIVVVCLLSVALLMTPALVSMVAANRFPELQARQGASWAGGLLWALSSTALATLALLISAPLWLVPPLALLLPPLIWGWLTYRVMAFDALALHASKQERVILLRRHSGSLLLMGVVVGFLGVSPSAVWALGMGFASAFALLLPFTIWVYTLVFIFASLWFTHFGLAALQALRAQEQPAFSGETVDAPTSAVAQSAQLPQHAAGDAPPIWKDAE